MHYEKFYCVLYRGNECLFLDRSNCILSMCIQFHYSLVVFIGCKHATYQVNRIAALDGQFASVCKCLIWYVLMRNLLSHSNNCRMGWRCHGNASGRSSSPAGISFFCILSMWLIKRLSCIKWTKNHYSVVPVELFLAKAWNTMFLWLKKNIKSVTLPLLSIRIDIVWNMYFRVACNSNSI